MQNENLRKYFLRGFVSTDGSLNTFLANKKSAYPRVEMCNVSKKLMLQVKNILEEFGFRTSIWSINRKHSRWQEEIRITVNGFEMLDKWDKIIGFSNPKQVKKLRKLAVKE